jgi:hypothetical protein
VRSGKDGHSGIDISRIIEPNALIQTRDCLQLTIAEIEVATLQVLGETFRIIGFGNDSYTSLRSPSEENLSRSWTIYSQLAIINMRFR